MAQRVYKQSCFGMTIIEDPVDGFPNVVIMTVPKMYKVPLEHRSVDKYTHSRTFFVASHHELVSKLMCREDEALPMAIMFNGVTDDGQKNFVNVTFSSQAPQPYKHIIINLSQGPFECFLTNEQTGQLLDNVHLMRNECYVTEDCDLTVRMDDSKPTSTPMQFGAIQRGEKKPNYTFTFYGVNGVLKNNVAPYDIRLRETDTIDRSKSPEQSSLSKWQRMQLQQRTVNDLPVAVCDMLARDVPDGVRISEDDGARRVSRRTEVADGVANNVNAELQRLAESVRTARINNPHGQDEIDNSADNYYTDSNFVSYEDDDCSDDHCSDDSTPATQRATQSAGRATQSAGRATQSAGRATQSAGRAFVNHLAAGSIEAKVDFKANPKLAGGELVKTTNVDFSKTLTLDFHLGFMNTDTINYVRTVTHETRMESTNQLDDFLKWKNLTLPPLETLRPLEQQVFASAECVICMCNGPQIITHTCRHKVVCQMCITELERHCRSLLCPVCRSNVVSQQLCIEACGA